MRKELNALVEQILKAIAERYVRNGYKIPNDILPLKDEAVEIFDKSENETDVKVLEKNKTRLEEILGIVTELNYASPKDS